MSRQQRLVIPELPHHLVVRGNNRRRLFSSVGDYLRFTWDLQFALLATDCVLHVLTLMSNHVHLVVTPPNELAMPRFVKRFAQRYAQWRNKAKDATGKLWEQRYFLQPLEDLYALSVVTAYVELNPVRGKLVRNPALYPWSTYALHSKEPGRSRIPPEIWTPSSWYQGLGVDDSTRARAFSDWVSECQARGTKPDRAAEIEAIERLSSEDYRRRIVRPDGTNVL